MMICRLLLLALAMLLGPPAQAQFALPGQSPAKARADPPAARPDAEDARAKIEALLAGARRQQLEQPLKGGAMADSDTAPVNEEQRLLDRLVVAYGGRLRVLDDLDKLKRAPAQDPALKTWLGEFAGPPPYSALRVDVLRDQSEAARERLHALSSTARALEAQKLTLIEAQKRAAEGVRLAEDRLARSRNQAQIEQARQNHEMAALRLRLVETELTTIDLGLQRTDLEIKAVQTLSGEMQRLLARVLPEQRLTREDLEQQQALLQSRATKVASELDRLVAQNTRRVGERDRLAKTAGANGSHDEAAARLHLLDEKLETDRIVLMSLSWLQTLLQATSDAWAQRYVAFHSPDAQTRQTVITALRRTKNDLATPRQLVDELQKAARTALREQELRLGGGIAEAGKANPQDTALLDTLKQRVEAFQRLDLASTRLERQLDRWLEDFGFESQAPGSDRWQLGTLQLAETLKRVWNFEMFAVEESTLIDGKTVTASYGVTVGKSVGALLLFVVGYALFSLLSKRLQRIMVGRFGVSEQLASVIRRWVMISLAIILIVFVLNLARIPLTVFAFLGGALAIGVGFGTQTIIKNVISGIIILFERKIRVGDIIALGGMTGHVTAVDLRASTVRGFDGVEALVPNSNFLENQVVNWTYSNPRIRREIKVGIAYGSAVHQAAEIIVGCARDHGQVLKDPAPEVFFEDFADSALLLALVFWVELGPTLVSRRVDSDLRYAIEKRLAAAGIVIPFPQRDVRLQLGEAVPVRMTPGG